MSNQIKIDPKAIEKKMFGVFRVEGLKTSFSNDQNVRVEHVNPICRDIFKTLTRARGV